MRIAFGIYVLALSLLLMPQCSEAFEYEVDMPSSVYGKHHMIRIKINKCDTFFKMTDEQFNKQMAGNLKLNTAKMVKIAIERESEGCAKTVPEPIYF